LEKAQEVAHLGSWELDLVHNRLSWSDEVYRIFGLKPQEFSATYEAFLERVYPDDRQKVDDAYGGSLRENSDSYEIEHRVVRKDTGKVRVVNERCEHLRDATGKITRSVGTVQDITDQKRNFDNLKKQEQEMSIMNRIAQILLNTPDENMYNEILKVLLEVTDSKLGTFGYIDENGDLIVPSLTRGAWWDQCNVPEKDIKFPCVNWGDGTWPRALREKKSNFTNEISMRVPKGHIPIKRHLTIPIIFRGESVGLIQIANRESDYTVEDIRLLENLASQIAPGLVARLQRDREEKKRKLVENQIKETVGILTEASAAILSAATQVTSSMMETTTAITEASITVEEVRQSARISSEKAKNVSDSAQRAAQASQSGQKAATENLVIMNGIREQMDSIAQTIIRLSEQSQSIGGIIASVTDIADQSNLLAVNAAIEAARAGEQGKSFAVVAQEMKILATQSKQATTQVRNILFDIQKATAEAVMATEKGSKSVETGVKQSKLTGEAIGILSEVSNDAIMASSQIVASSHQQVVGMDQIGVAIQSINQAGNETAVSMTQTESSARNLHELGRKLKEMVDKFKK
jgi:PAS domain S-box-containing protein